MYEGTAQVRRNLPNSASVLISDLRGSSFLLQSSGITAIPLDPCTLRSYHWIATASWCFCPEALVHAGNPSHITIRHTTTIFQAKQCTASRGIFRYCPWLNSTAQTRPAGLVVRGAWCSPRDLATVLLHSTKNMAQQVRAKAPHSCRVDVTVVMQIPPERHTDCLPKIILS